VFFIGDDEMSKDDYYVIAYRFLKYLYDCLKQSKSPNIEVLDAEFFDIDDEYWEYIIKNLYEEGFVEGITLVPVLNRKNPLIKGLNNIRITPKGISYLFENSLFQKIKGTVKDIADILPF
jgi:hypothetical protein